MPVRGKATQISVGGVQIPQNLLRTVKGPPKSIGTDDETTIAAAAELRGGTIPSFGAARFTAFWLKSNAEFQALAAADDEDLFAIVITYADGHTETFSAICTLFDKNDANRQNRLELTVELTPAGDVTYTFA